MTAFGGFPPATTRFLGELRANNRKDWFDAHRADYEAHWVAPAKAFVVAAGQQLAELAPEPLGVGAGCHGLDPERLTRFRQAVADPASGAELAGIAQRLEAAGYQLGGAVLKRPPAGVAAAGPASRFLRHKALFVHHDEPADERVQTAAVLAECMRHWSALAPLHRWLTDNIQAP